MQGHCFTFKTRVRRVFWTCSNNPVGSLHRSPASTIRALPDMRGEGTVMPLNHSFNDFSVLSNLQHHPVLVQETFGIKALLPCKNIEYEKMEKSIVRFSTRKKPGTSERPRSPRVSCPRGPVPTPTTVLQKPRKTS